jgi:hypothetical protein
MVAVLAVFPVLARALLLLAVISLWPLLLDTRFAR